jgi:hypothetical protein
MRAARNGLDAMMYWISFASDQGFLGVVIAEGETPQAALAAVTELNLNPGGEAMLVEIPTVAYRHHAWPYRNRLLQRGEIARIFGPAADPHEVQEAAGEACSVVCESCNTPAVSGSGALTKE